MPLVLRPASPLSSAAHFAGVLYALGCFSIWGLFPVYFKWLHHVSALEVLAHRIVWSAVLLLALIFWRGEGQTLLNALRDPRRLGFYLCTTLLIAANWLLYIWTVQNGRILEASLGYYINPLVNVLLGVLVLGERLKPLHWLAVAIAAGGVLILVVGYGTFPWISLALALSFGGYGLLRKKDGHAAILGLAVETGLLAPVALLFLLVLGVNGSGAFGALDRETDGLLSAAGLVTVIPLVMFLEAGRRLHLSVVGLIQYLTPTLQFLLAVVVYREPFTALHLAAFGCIWLALTVYSADAYSVYRHRMKGSTAGLLGQQETPS